MPKIIENLRERLILETERQLRETGYTAVTVRSVAKSCGIGVGTVYNYFPSKDDMIAACLLADWEHSVDTVRAAASVSETAKPVLYVLYRELSGYALTHASLFSDPVARANYGYFAHRYHAILRTQLAQPLRKFCLDDFTAEFLAEAMITWTLAGKSFEGLYSLVQKLI